MLSAYTLILVGVASPVSEIKLAYGPSLDFKATIVNDSSQLVIMNTHIYNRFTHKHKVIMKIYKINVAWSHWVCSHQSGGFVG